MAFRMYAAMGYPLSSSITALLKVLDADRSEHYERITQQAKRAELFDRLVNERECFSNSKITNATKRMENVEYTHAMISAELANAIQAEDYDKALDLCEDLKSLATSPEELAEIDNIIDDLENNLAGFDGGGDDDDDDYDDDDDDDDEDGNEYTNSDNLVSYAGDVPPGFFSVKGAVKKRKEEKKAKKTEKQNTRLDIKKQNAANKQLKAEARAQLIRDRGESQKTLASQGVNPQAGKREFIGKIVDGVGKVAGSVTTLAGGGPAGGIVSDIGGALGGILGSKGQPIDAENLGTIDPKGEQPKGGGMPVWGWVLIGVGAVAIIGGAIWFFTRKKKATK